MLKYSNFFTKVRFLFRNKNKNPFFDFNGKLFIDKNMVFQKKAELNNGRGYRYQFVGMYSTLPVSRETIDRLPTDTIAKIFIKTYEGYESFMLIDEKSLREIGIDIQLFEKLFVK